MQTFIRDLRQKFFPGSRHSIEVITHKFYGFAIRKFTQIANTLTAGLINTTLCFVVYYII